MCFPNLEALAAIPAQAVKDCLLEYQHEDDAGFLDVIGRATGGSHSPWPMIPGSQAHAGS